MPDAEQQGRRIRAALALNGRTSADVAPDLNISARTLDRTIAGERQARAWELGRLAELLSVPNWFLEAGFEGEPDSGDVTEPSLAIVLGEIRGLARRFDELEAGLRSQARLPSPGDVDPAAESRAAAAAAQEAEERAARAARAVKPPREQETG